MIVDISPFKNGILLCDPNFLDFVIKPTLIVVWLALQLITFPLQVRFFFFRFRLGFRLALAAPRVAKDLIVYS